MHINFLHNNCYMLVFNWTYHRPGLSWDYPPQYQSYQPSYVWGGLVVRYCSALFDEVWHLVLAPQNLWKTVLNPKSHITGSLQSVLQIRRSSRDNIGIIFIFLPIYIFYDPSLEPSCWDKTYVFVVKIRKVISELSLLLFLIWSFDNAIHCACNFWYIGILCTGILSRTFDSHDSWLPDALF